MKDGIMNTLQGTDENTSQGVTAQTWKACGVAALKEEDAFFTLLLKGFNRKENNLTDRE